jgi:hypothetical protein
MEKNDEGFTPTGIEYERRQQGGVYMLSLTGPQSQVNFW